MNCKPGRRVFFFLFNVLYWGALSCIVPYLGPYYEARGLGGVQIGLLGGCMSLVTILASFIVNLFTDITRRPKLVLMGCCLMLIVGGILIRLSTITGAIFISAAVFYFSNAPVVPISDKLILDSISKNPEHYSWFRLGGSAGYCIGSLVIGMIIAHTGLLSIFPVFIGVMLVCTLCVLPISAEPIQTVKPQKNNLREYAALFRHKKFVSIYCTLALWGLAEAALTFLTLHLKNNDFNSRHIGLLLADAMVGEIAGFLLTVRLLKRIGPEKTIALSFVCQIIRSGSLAMLVPLPLMIVCQFIGGFSLPMIWASITYQVNETFPARIGNLAQGLKVVALNGLALLIGIPLCGILYQHVSSNSIFWMITAICVLYITGFCLKKAKRLTKFP